MFTPLSLCLDIDRFKSLSEDQMETTIRMKRVGRAYYTARVNGKSVAVYMTWAKGANGGSTNGWNLEIDGKIVSNWHTSKNEAANCFEQFFSK